VGLASCNLLTVEKRHADEPNLDSKNGDAVMELLNELHKEEATICR
jgi:ABC-type lipoprotein export system ATPase subunit